MIFGSHAMPHKAVYLDKAEHDNDIQAANTEQYNSVIDMCNQLIRAQLTCGKVCYLCLEKCESLQKYLDFNRGNNE
jgi:hypothetical protein